MYLSGLGPPASGLFVTPAQSILAQLMAVIEDRKVHPSEKSYTIQLLQGGVEATGKKLLEEAAEVVAAAAEPGDAGRAHTIYEAADVLYHLLVLLGCRDISLAEVEAELARRFGTSGLDEKAARGSSTPSTQTPPG